jgi:hypothetical protein
MGMTIILTIIPARALHVHLASDKRLANFGKSTYLVPFSLSLSQFLGGMNAMGLTASLIRSYSCSDGWISTSSR